MKQLFIIVITIFSLCLLGCNKYEPSETIRDDFSFTLDDTVGVRADGTSFITLRLRNTQKLKEGLSVVFSTNKGTILQAEQPYSGNQAETKLLLAEDVGPYSIKATVKEGSVIHVEKFIAVSFRPAFQQNEFNLEIIDSSGVRANSVAMIGVRFTSPVQHKQGLVIHFETTKGALLQADVPFVNGSAQTKLTVDQSTGTYLVKAQLKDGNTVKMEKSVSFTIRSAYPQVISLELNSSSWNLTQSLLIKTLLTRADGKVTIGQPVFYRAYQLNNAGDTVNVGRFEGLLNNVSNAAGMLNDIRLFLDTPNIMDTLKTIGLQAKALNDQADTIRRTVILPFRR